MRKDKPETRSPLKTKIQFSKTTMIGRAEVWWVGGRARHSAFG